MPQFDGIIAALITPFDENGELYVQGVENEIRYIKEQNIPNVFACGSYGAFPTMSHEQRIKMAELVVRFAREAGIKLIVQIGGCSTGEAVKRARHAESLGVDAISAVVPFYYSGTFYNEDHYLAYFEQIIKSVSIPVHFYNNANTTGFNASPSFLGKLIDIGLRGIKDGGSEMERIMAMLRVVKEKGVDFDYYPASTNALMTGFLLGLRSCISGVSLTVPQMVLSIREKILNGVANQAVETYNIVMRVRAALGRYSYRAVAAYDILNAKGVDVGTCKPPWRRLSREQSSEVIDELKSLGIDLQ